MNKIFKVIYSKTRHCYVVVSELAKSHCKTTQSHTVRSKTALTAAVLLALGTFSFVGMPSVQADESALNNDYVAANDSYYYYDEKDKTWKTYPYKATDILNNRSRNKLPNYQGAGAKLPGAITAGLYAQAGQQTITIGDRNAGQSKGSVFIGEHSGYNNGDNAPVGLKNNYVTSVGFQSDATGWGSIAIGSNAIAENSKTDKWVVKEDGNYNTSGTVDDDTYSIDAKPTIEGASVALGYNAHSKDGNIAIGANSEATSTDKGDSYVSVGNGTLKRRITNVAKGTDNSDVVTVGQMNDAIKQADNLNVNAGWGINVADENDPTNTRKGTKNVISLKHNLGTGYNDDEANGMIIGGLVEDRDPAKQYGAADANSVIVGAGKALASGKSSVVVGGLDNVASGATSVVVGGDNNNAAGNQSAVFGGRDNTAAGIASTAGGGIMNVANGQQAVALGGAYNYALGTSSTAIGGTGGNGMYGYSTSVNGNYSVSLAGGSTGTDALNGLAAGNQSVVTTANGTAVGYQATTDKEGTIAFGHDSGDVSGYAVTWKKRTDGKTNADHTTNDYTQVPDSVTPTTYKDAYYNRLVKVADGQDAHDVVVMEQLTKATNDLTKDLSVNAGWGINVADEKDTTGKVTKNVISLNRNLGTNYGDPWKGEGKVTFEAGGENSMILGGAASILFNNEEDNVKAGAYGKDSVLVGGFNNLIDTVANDVTQTGEDAVIVGGDTNTVTGLRSVIVGGSQNKVSGGHSIVIGGASNETDGGGAGVFGGQLNKAAGEYSSVLGGVHNEADGDWSSAIGGTTNIASGRYATVLGGVSNDAKGNESVVVGGGQNVAIGEDSTVNGGADNTSYGSSSYAAGGMKNMAFGNASVALGGQDSSVNGKASTGIAGGSTGENAMFTLAAGYQSVVADSGVEWRPITQDEADKIRQGINPWPGFSGLVDYGEDFSAKGLGRISTAVGYQSTADAPGVIAFGHDKGDVASVAKKWKQKATEKDGKYYDANDKEISIDDYYKLVNADGTWNDYTQDPIGTENTTYQSAYYNRLVKAADGIDAHDAVVMEQLKPYTKSDASNVGANLKTYTVGEDGETITEADATPEKQKKNKDDWGKALGADPFTAGTTATATDASTSDQLVTGKTLYNYDAPVAETGKTLNYVSANNTTGQNLSALDAQVKSNADTLNDKTHNIKYYSVKTLPLTVEGYTNENNDGAKGMGSLAAGFVTHADGIASTVAGSYSGVINSGNAQGRDLRGAAALSYGTFNVNQNTDIVKEHSGVANSIVGQANMTTDSNAAIIYGAGNTVTNSYRPIDKDKALAILGNVADPTKLSKAMQDAVKESGGQVMVMGGGNNVESAYMSQVVGVGNTVKGADSTYAEGTSTQYNFVDGFQNELTNGKHDYIIGSNNKVSGDSIDKNQSNIVFGDNHKLTDQKNNVIIGSSDTTDDETKASDVVAIGHNAKVSAEGGVAIGSGSEATVTGKSTEGYDPTIGKNSTDTTATWKATNAAVSIGKADGTVTRQINGVAAGTNDTDAVNVAQLKNATAGMTTKGLNFQGNNTDVTVHRDLGSTLTIKGNGTKDDSSYSADNIKVVGDANGSLTIMMDKEIKGDRITVGEKGEPGKEGQAGKDGVDGQIGVNGKDGSAVVINGKDGSIGLNGKDGANGLTIKGAKGDAGVDGTDGHDGKDGMTRIVYEDHNKVTHKVATLDDGMKYAGDFGDGAAVKLDKTVNIKGNVKEGAKPDDFVDGNIAVVANKKGDNGELQIKLNKNLTGLNSATYTTTTGEGESAKPSTTTVDGNGLTIMNGPSITNNGVDAGKKAIMNVGSGASSITKDANGKDVYTYNTLTNAANVGDVKNIAASTESGMTTKGLNFQGNNTDVTVHRDLGSTLTIKGNGTKDDSSYSADNIKVVGDANGSLTIMMDKEIKGDRITVGEKGEPGKEGQAGKDGVDGQIGVNGKDGSAVVINGKDGSIGLNGKDGANGLTIKGAKGDAGVDGTDGHDGKDGMTRIVYEDHNKVTHKVATLDDGMKYAGDFGDGAAVKLDKTVNIKGNVKEGAKPDDFVDGNIAVVANKKGDNGELQIKLNKNLTGLNSATYTTTTGEGESAKPSTTTVDGNGLTIMNGPSITNNGVDAGKKAITNVGSGIEKDSAGKYTVTDQNKGNAANIGDVQNMVNETVNSAADTTNKALAGKANVDASNIGANLKGEDGKTPATEEEKTKNENAWGSAIGTGKIEANNGQLVTGKTIYEYNKPVAEDGKTLNYVSEGKTTGQNLGALDAQVRNNADAIKKNSESIQNITNNVKNLSDNAVQYDKDSNKTKVTLGGGEGGTTITNVKDGALSENSSDAVNGKQLYNEQEARKAADKAITEKVTNNTNEITKIKNGDFTDASKTAIHNIAKDAVKVVDGKNTKVTTVDGTDTTPTTYAVNVEGTGKVASGDTGLISGGTLYNEVHVTTDGSYIKGSQTVGQNLSALDTGLKTTSDLIHTNTKGDTIQIGGNSTATKIDVNGKDGKGRVITGVVSDANDPNSAANVGYVNGLTAANTQQIYRDMNNAYSRLDTNINRAAAGSNALAALHPLDFDPADKASFAVGYGHYRNANAAAVGAFYQPNANTMVNMGVSLGNGDPGFNAGVSFKIGKGSAYNGVSKAEMAQTIHDQATEISAIKADDAAKDKRIDALEKENQEMKKQIQEILARLNG